MFITTSGVGYRARLSFISVKILKRSDVHRGTHRSTVNLTKSLIIWMLLKLEQSLLWVRISVIWLYMFKHIYNMIILYMVKYIWHECVYMYKYDIKTENRKETLFLKERGHMRRMEEGGWREWMRKYNDVYIWRCRNEIHHFIYELKKKTV